MQICPRCHGNGRYDKIDAKVVKDLLVMEAPVEVPCDEPGCAAGARWMPQNLHELAGYISGIGVLTKYHPQDALDILVALDNLGVLTPFEEDEPH